MKKKRNTSYKHCLNLGLKLLDIQEDIKNISINIINIMDDKVEMDIILNDKSKRMFIEKKIKKEKKLLKPESLNNLKNIDKNKKFSNDRKNEQNGNIEGNEATEIDDKNKKDNLIIKNIDFKEYKKFILLGFLYKNRDAIKNIINKNNKSVNEVISSEDNSSNNIILENNISQNIIKIENKNDQVGSVKDLVINDDKVIDNLDNNENSGINQNVLNLENKNNNDWESDSDFYEEDDDSVIELPEPCDDCEVTRKTCQDNYEVGLKYMNLYEETKNELEKSKIIAVFLNEHNQKLISENKELKSKIIKKDENLKVFVEWANETNENKKKLIKINKNLFKLFSDIIDINGKYLDNNNKFIRYLDKKLNTASLRLIYNEKIKTQNILNEIIERFDNIQDDIEKELNSFQDLLMKKD